ncbi:MAG: sigma-70 family RNA polymerase sigma factor [Candidatus Eisenbacteria bacterium]|nr:sigma-70 family RNA polymerase sigma factor [Candidatus Latescibacterota bacterium]MBD3302996.1 sigma-70 family RNA polymerase sigma factor [Candidatus Eisenbacteria bacterium]
MEAIRPPSLGSRPPRSPAPPSSGRLEPVEWRTTQATLLARLRDPEDHEAWAEFDRTYGELILRYCRKRGLALSDAEDVRQIVLLSLVRSFPKFEYRREKGRFRGYLGRTVRNAIFRYNTRPHRSLELLVLDGDRPPELAAPDDHDEVWEREWIDHHLRLAIDRIRDQHDPKSLEVFGRLLAGERVRQVADSLGMSPAAVHKIKQRIRDRLKEQIARQLEEEDPSK